MRKNVGEWGSLSSEPFRVANIGESSAIVEEEGLEVHGP